MDFFAVALIFLLVLSILGMASYVIYRALTGGLSH